MTLHRLGHKIAFLGSAATIGAKLVSVVMRDGMIFKLFLDIEPHVALVAVKLVNARVNRLVMV